MRFVDLGAQDTFENAAATPLLVRHVAETGTPVLMTSVWGDTHLDVGWFDDVDVTLDLQACRRLGVTVTRRFMYGGGTAFYDAGCAAMVSWMLPKETHPDLDAEHDRLRPVMLDALERMGLGEVQIEGSSDLRWRGRKMGGFPAQDVVRCHTVGGFLNLRPPDIDLYLQVVRVPDDKFKDKVVKDMREYVVTAADVRGAPLPYEEYRDAIVAATKAAGIDLEARPLGPGEEPNVEKARARMASDDHVRRISSARFRAAAPGDARVGFANHKGRKLCRAGVAVAGDGTIAAAMIAGDMHVSPPDAMDRVAASLVGAKAADPGDLRARIAAVVDGGDVQQEQATAVTTDDLLAAVTGAVADATGERA